MEEETRCVVIHCHIDNDDLRTWEWEQLENLSGLVAFSFLVNIETEEEGWYDGETETVYYVFLRSVYCIYVGDWWCFIRPYY